MWLCSNPNQYSLFIEFNAQSAISFQTRLELAQKAFNHTFEYEQGIAKYFDSIVHSSDRSIGDDTSETKKESHDNQINFYVNTPLQ